LECSLKSVKCSKIFTKNRHGCNECNYICTDIEAEHRFWQLRQRFGRERKKVIQSQGRSGAGITHLTYTPQWNLYNELIFLADVIKHRM